MAQRGCLILLFLVMTINVCNSHWMGNRDRRMPPPVASFLEKLRGLSNQRIKRDVRDYDNSISTGEESKEDIQTESSSDSDQTLLSSLLHLREKRYASSSTRGCHLGTCQIQNLANMIYLLGKNSYKDGSNRDTKDPLGYGRRRRSLRRNKERTDVAQTLLAT